MLRRVKEQSSRLRARLAREDGFTLIELIVVAVIALVALGTTLLLYQVTVSRTSDTAARNETLANVRGALERMTRDIREGESVTVGGGGSSVTIETPIERITYSCTGGTCSRSTATLAGVPTDGPDEVISDLDGSTVVFATAPVPGTSRSAYRVTLAGKPDGRDRPIVLTEDVTLRNECVTYSLLSACT